MNLVNKKENLTKIIISNYSGQFRFYLQIKILALSFTPFSASALYGLSHFVIVSKCLRDKIRQYQFTFAVFS